MKKFAYVGLDDELRRTHTAFVDRPVAEEWTPLSDRGPHGWRIRPTKS
ncbi:MAG: hypothetical protein K8S98_02035 [Planctomycetes bacterium]|nr:hypothetical protein [Planctomycetota bacterium]